MNSFQILHGDCRELMRELGDGSVDAVVTDPPYELGFMGKSWDRSGIAYQVDVWRQVLRVLKPGGYLVAAGGSRTYHRLACAIEDAGFEMRDTICHVFATGFPKNLDISKAIDAEAGVEREVVAKRRNNKGDNGAQQYAALGIFNQSKWSEVTAPATEAAKRWEGWGTALKPAAEYWTVARKLLEGTVAQNVLRHGTGGLNIHGCRVGTGKRPFRVATNETGKYEGWGNLGGGRAVGETDQGRWPPNFVMSHSPDCAEDCVPSCPIKEMDRQGGETVSCYRISEDVDDPGSTWSLNRSGITQRGHSDSGGTSRFFPCFRYEAKASRRERDEGLWELPLQSAGEVTNRKDGTAGLDSPRAGAGRTGGGRNTHPTVKPIAFMRWLVRLVTPPGGLILDPFAGSGSTGCAAVAEDFRFVGMETDPESADIARRRVEYWAGIGYQVALF